MLRRHVLLIQCMTMSASLDRVLSDGLKAALTAQGKNGSSKRASLSNTTSCSPEELLEASKDLAVASDELSDDMREDDVTPSGLTHGLQETPGAAMDIGRGAQGGGKVENFA